MWPFNKKQDDQFNQDSSGANEAVNEQADSVESSQTSGSHDAVNGDRGPFDGDSVNFDDFDFSDFAVGLLNLGSMKLPLPKGSQVQVEMGDDGPKLLHIVTQYGRISPVAFAAPRTPGQWMDASDEISEGMAKDGMDPHFENGPWGREIVAKGSGNALRMIGVEGPRWMLRVTLMSPETHAEELTALGRELVARTFVYRGDEPILAGNSLPVIMPPQLVEQMQKAMEARRAQQGEQTQQDGTE